jgi:flagellar biogenesis protein FliO
MNTIREYHTGSASGTTATKTVTRWLNAFLSALRSIRIRNRKRTLQLCETLPLGDKRFLAVVQFNRQRLLIGATSHSICLLQSLAASDVAVSEVNDPLTNCSQSVDD